MNINCPKCGNNINTHNAYGLVNVSTGDMCTESPESIAAHYIGQAAEVIEELKQEKHLWGCGVGRGSKTQQKDDAFQDKWCDCGVYRKNKKAAAFLRQWEAELEGSDPQIKDGMSSPEWFDAQEERKW